MMVYCRIEYQNQAYDYRGPIELFPEWISAILVIFFIKSRAREFGGIRVTMYEEEKIDR